MCCCEAKASPGHSTGQSLRESVLRCFEHVFICLGATVGSKDPHRERGDGLRPRHVGVIQGGRHTKSNCIKCLVNSCVENWAWWYFICFSRIVVMPWCLTFLALISATLVVHIVTWTETPVVPFLKSQPGLEEPLEELDDPLEPRVVAMLNLGIDLDQVVLEAVWNASMLSLNLVALIGAYELMEPSHDWYTT